MITDVYVALDCLVPEAARLTNRWHDTDVDPVVALYRRARAALASYLLEWTDPTAAAVANSAEFEQWATAWINGDSL